jgi:hypothetical protein
LQIHAERVELPEGFHPIVKGLIMKDDSLVYNPEKVEQVFKPVFKEMGKIK